jgi:uncharacterized damage-inducible protein DinB
MTDTLINVLFAYDAWASRQLLAACRTVSQEQFDTELSIGPGSLSATVTHLIGAMFFFADRLNRQAPRPRWKQDTQPTPDSLAPLLEQAIYELQAAASNALATHELTDILNWTDTDIEPADPLDQITYAVALAQIIDHGIHHRTQAMAMLQLLGTETLTEWHPFEWDEALRTSPIDTGDHL